jgi:hypothetical protein
MAQRPAQHSSFEMQKQFRIEKSVLNVFVSSNSRLCRNGSPAPRLEHRKRNVT